MIMYLFFSWNYINFNFKHLSVQKLFRGVRYTSRLVSFFTNYGVRFIARLRHFRRVWRRTPRMPNSVDEFQYILSCFDLSFLFSFFFCVKSEKVRQLAEMIGRTFYLIIQVL